MTSALAMYIALINSRVDSERATIRPHFWYAGSAPQAGQGLAWGPVPNRAGPTRLVRGLVGPVGEAVGHGQRGQGKVFRRPRQPGVLGIGRPRTHCLRPDR